ncbi:MAG: site-specific integrase [Trueperaceae bacterium]|nr:site-specific integrase [Trueperaceae bacterium]
MPRDQGTILELEKGKKYLVKAYLGLDDNFKRIYKSKTVKGTLREAQRVKRELLTLKDTGRVDRSTETFNQHAESWLKGLRHSVRAVTIRQYRARLKTCQKAFGDTPLKKLKLADIQALCNDMFDAGRARRTVEYTHTVLKSCLEDAVRHGKIISNPASLYKLPKRTERKPPKAFSQTDIERLLEAAKATEYYLFYCLMLFAGLRPSEVAGLTWEYVDLDQGFIRVEKTITRFTKSRWSFEQPKTKKSRRTIVIGSFLADLLATHKLNSPANSYDLVLTDDMLEPVDIRTVANIAFKQLKKELDLPDYPLYSLRATHLTHFEQVAGIQLTSKRAGHANIQITSHHYVNPQVEAEKQAVFLFEQKLLQSAKNTVN